MLLAISYMLLAIIKYSYTIFKQYNNDFYLYAMHDLLLFLIH